MPNLTNNSLDDIALYLTDGFWEDRAAELSEPNIIRHSFPVSPGGTLTIDMSTVAAAGRYLAEKALEAWTMVSGIEFLITNVAGADITFRDDIEYDNQGNEVNPYGGSSWNAPSGEAFNGNINISTNWVNYYGTELDSYSFQTYMHEIGHVLGLGHAGYYNGSGGYAEDGSGANDYLNDSWQASIMSYFSPYENTSIAAGWDYFVSGFSGVMTPMIADILAIQALYGTAGNLRTGDTTYGQGSNAGGYYDDWIKADAAFTIIDDGGIDTINFSNETANQTVDLNPEAISSVGGLTGNMVIMRGTIIENFKSGSGDDFLTGNIAKNVLWGGDGKDVIKGKGGGDIIRGDNGNDVLNGNGKDDLLIGGLGNDILRGGRGADVLDGGNGDDTLMGGIGRDRLVGGAGADTFVFKVGWAVDRISDFEDDVDTIRLDSSLWGGGLTVQQMLDIYGSNVTNPNTGVSYVELDFNNGLDKLKIFGITDINLLDSNDIIIF